MKNDLSVDNMESYFNFHVDDYHSRHVIKSHNALRILLEFIRCPTVMIISQKLKSDSILCSTRRYGYSTCGDIIWTVLHKELNI